MAKSNYFSNTHALQTCPTIDGVRSLVAYSMLLVRDRGIMKKNLIHLPLSNVSNMSNTLIDIRTCMAL